MYHIAVNMTLNESQCSSVSGGCVKGSYLLTTMDFFYSSLGCGTAPLFFVLFALKSNSLNIKWALEKIGTVVAIHCQVSEGPSAPCSTAVNDDWLLPHSLITALIISFAAILWLRTIPELSFHKFASINKHLLRGVKVLLLFLLLSDMCNLG